MGDFHTGNQQPPQVVVPPLLPFKRTAPCKPGTAEDIEAALDDDPTTELLPDASIEKSVKDKDDKTRS